MLNLEAAATAITFLFGIIVSILLAGIPWAYSVHGRLTKIETSLQAYLSLAERLPNIEHRLTKLELWHISGDGSPLAGGEHD